MNRKAILPLLLAQIPAVLPTQQGRSCLYHTAPDTPDQIDLARLQQAVDLVSELGRHIASPGTLPGRTREITSTARPGRM